MGVGNPGTVGPDRRNVPQAGRRVERDWRSVVGGNGLGPSIRSVELGQIPQEARDSVDIRIIDP